MFHAPDHPAFSRLLADRAPIHEGEAAVRDTRAIEFVDELAGRVAERARASAVTKPSIMLALFAATVSRFCGDAVTVRLTGRAMRACAGGRSDGAPGDMAFDTVTLPTLDFATDPGLVACARDVQQRVDQWAFAGGLSFPHTSATAASMLFDVVRDDGIVATEDPAELVFTVRLADDAMLGSISFDATRFEAENIKAFAMALATLADLATRAPDIALSRHATMDLDTRDRIVVAWNRTDATRRVDALIHQLFERQVEATPEAPAAEHEGLVLTYRELNSRANHLARILVKQGVASDSLVGLSMERSPELVVTILAILKAGGTFVPLDPDLPPERLTHILSDTRATLLLTQPHLADRLRSAAVLADAVLLQVPPLQDSTAAVKLANLEPRSSSDRAAYVIYTSGSTGQPKGVRVPHRALCNHARWFADTIGLSSSDRVLQYASISFDASMAEIFAPLAVGATVVLAAPYAHRDVLGLTDIIRDQRISVLQMVPSALRAALGVGAFGGPSTLRFLVVGGESLDRSLVITIQAAMPGVRLGNFYGPSEACVDSTMIEIDASLLQRNTVPIGRPIANARCHILDRHLQPVPIGAPGELYIGGYGLAQGYHEQPVLTASRFVADPFRDGERLYRSGDLARYCGDGTIEYLGRVDTQIKLRGYRLELSEIEEALLRYPGVADAAVVLRADNEGEPTLVAYLVCSSSAPPPEAISSRLRQRLPTYAVPTAYVSVDAMPLTPNGKLDRRALAERPIPRGCAAHNDGHDVGGDPTERRLRAIWEQMLGVSPVGLDDDFFALGGHSIKAIRLLNDVEREFGMDIRAGVLFEAPTIRRFAERVRERRPRLVSTTIPVQPLGRALPLFFVPGGAGELFVFDALARELGTEQPLHVMDLYAFGEHQHHVTHGGALSLEEISARMIVDMRVVQPHGPYRLAGYSLGGNIAIEIAQQLRAADHEVSSLVLLDCDAPGYPHLQPFFPRTWTHVRHAVSLRPRDMLRYLRARTARLVQRLRGESTPAHTLFDKEAELALIPPNVVERMERALLPLIGAWERYVPQRYDGPVTLVRADIRTPMVGVVDNDPVLGWTGILTDMHTDRMACGHLDILRAPQARRLAEILRGALHRVDAAVNA